MITFNHQKWKVTYFSDRVFSLVSSLPAATRTRYLSLIDRMLFNGPNLGMPHTRAMGEGLFELRIKSEDGNTRVFYCSVKKEEITVLHIFSKKTQKTPTKELTLAKKRLKKVKSDDRKKPTLA